MTTETENKQHEKPKARSRNSMCFQTGGARRGNAIKPVVLAQGERSTPLSRAVDRVGTAHRDLVFWSICIGNAPGVWQVRRLVADGKETCRAKEAGSRRAVTTWIGTLT
jgi:hypothetical protein